MNEDLGRTSFNRDPISSCFVPKCKNKVRTARDKHFFRVPDHNKNEWCVAVGKPKVSKGSLYICEDHLNLDEDMLNYNELISKSAYGKLKTEVPKLRNILLNTGAEQIASTSFIRHTTELNDKSTMCQPETRHKHVQIKPKTADRCIATDKPLKKTKKRIYLDPNKIFQEFDVEH